jgi:hypothetical protein
MQLRKERSVRTKIFWLSATVLTTLAACFLLRMGQAHWEGLRGEPSQIVSARSAEITAEKLLIALIPVSLQPIALPQDELGKLGEKTLQNLPTQNDFKNLTSEQAHTTPPFMFEAGMKLKKFEDLLDQKMKAFQGDPRAQRLIAAEGADFYENCSDQAQTPSSVRAVCYIHFIELSVKSGHPENIPKNRMPLEVLTIAKKILPVKA